mgnify:CR=1 FL=1
MVRVAELTGHTSRVLHMAQSPDGTTVCTAAVRVVSRVSVSVVSRVSR